MRFLFLLLFALAANANPITAKSYLITDERGIVITEHMASRTQPVASITKLMTVITVLNAQQSLNEQLKLNWAASKKYHTRLPREVKKLTRDDLIDLALVKSDNLAAYTLCENYPGGVNNCVDQMNATAVRLGMTHTHFVDPTGLDEGNVSNAYDLARLVIEAADYPDIVDAGHKPEVKIEIKKHWWEFNNTNPLVKKTGRVVVSKTGYIHQSGGCVAMMLDTEQGTRVIVVLGSKNTHTRIPEAEQLLVTITASDVRVH